MKTLRIALLGLALSAGLVSGADAHGSRIGLSVNLGYPVYAQPVYYPPPPVVYVRPPPQAYVYGPPPFVVSPYRYTAYPYGYDYGPRRGWHRHGRHHRH